VDHSGCVTACEVMRLHFLTIRVRIVAMYSSCMATDNTDQPDLLRVTTRKPQSADGAVSNTPVIRKNSIIEIGAWLYPVSNTV